MKLSTILAASLVTMATASPTYSTTPEGALAVTAAASTYVPICKFDPVKGEYVCPSVDAITEGNVNVRDVDATAKGDNTVVAAADCNKCKADWDVCMTHWGCWFYDCQGPCKCEVGRNDPSCTGCEYGKC